MTAGLCPPDGGHARKRMAQLMEPHVIELCGYECGARASQGLQGSMSKSASAPVMFWLVAHSTHM